MKTQIVLSDTEWLMIQQSLHTEASLIRSKKISLDYEKKYANELSELEDRINVLRIKILREGK